MKSAVFVNVPLTYLVTSTFRELKEIMSKEIDSGLVRWPKRLWQVSYPYCFAGIPKIT